MTAFVEAAQPMGTASLPASGTSTSTIGARLADLWPLAMIVLGLVLTLIWAGGWVWLLLSFVLSFV